MSLNRWNAKRDANEVAIVRALRQAGAEIIRCDVFDLLVLTRRGELRMLDCKVAKGRATAAQDALIAAGWPLVYVHDPIDALKAIGAVR